MNNSISNDLNIIIPAYNEAKSLAKLLARLNEDFPEAEIIVVNDGSTDDTKDIVTQYNCRCLHHPYNKGNGAAIKTGARAATKANLLFMDADGQHQSTHINQLIKKYQDNYDLVVGARKDASSQANVFRHLGNKFYNFFASKIVGHKIADLTSGLRLVNAQKFKQFIHLLPNGFSYPSTSTMAFYRAGYSVAFVPIDAAKRTGKSHLKPLKDGVRFLLIIYKVAILYSPLKVFVPMSFILFILGLTNYAYTYITHSRFTNMSAMILLTAVIIFVIALVSEQITVLMYQPRDDSHEDLS